MSQSSAWRGPLTVTCAANCDFEHPPPTGRERGPSLLGRRWVGYCSGHPHVSRRTPTRRVPRNRLTNLQEIGNVSTSWWATNMARYAFHTRKRGLSQQTRSMPQISANRTPGHEQASSPFESYFTRGTKCPSLNDPLRMCGLRPSRDLTATRMFRLEPVPRQMGHRPAAVGTP